MIEDIFTPLQGFVAKSPGSLQLAFSEWVAAGTAFGLVAVSL